MPSLLSDKDIIEQVLKGSVNSYAHLVRRWRKAVCAVAVQILQDRHQAEDVAQETFIKAYEKLATLKNPHQFGSWLMQIAKNQALDQYRRLQKCPPCESLSATEIPASHATTSLNHEERDLLNIVMQLPAHEREVVMLKYFDGHTARQIAQITGRPTGTITQQLSRAYTRLRRLMQTGEES